MDQFPFDEMKFLPVNSQVLDFGNVTNNVLLALNKTTEMMEKISPVDLIGKLITSGDRINFEFDGSKYVLSVEYNLDNLEKIDSELTRIVSI